MDIRPLIFSARRPINFQRALAFGWQRLLAFGNGSCISVVDFGTGKLFQSLALHTVPVTEVEWAPENYYHDAKNPYCHRLASADLTGRIIVWNVATATAISEGIEPGSSVCAMQWVTDQDISRDLLAVLHSDNKLVLWNAQTCTMLWKKSYSVDASAFSFDPFNSKNIIIKGENSFLLVEDFSWNEAPTSSGKKVNFCGVSGDNSDNLVASGAVVRGRLSRALKATAKAMIGDRLFGFPKTSKQSESAIDELEELVMESPIQVLFHRYRKQHLIFVYPREICIFDMIICQVIETICLEKSSSSFMQVYSCKQADMLICLLATGIITLFLNSMPPISELVDLDKDVLTNPAVSFYTCVGESDSLRRGRNFRIVSMAVDPCRELLITVAASDGKLKFFEIQDYFSQETISVWPSWTLMDMVESLRMHKSCKRGGLKLRFRGFFDGLSPTPSVCSVCPAHFLLPVASVIKHKSLIAIGTMRGTIQILDMQSAKVWREYQVLTVPIRGLSWGIIGSDCGLIPPLSSLLLENAAGEQLKHHLVIFAHGWQPLESSALSCIDMSTGASTLSVKNFVVRLNLHTGEQRQISSQRAGEYELHILKLAMQNSGSAKKIGPWMNFASEMTDHSLSNTNPIRSMCVSHLGQYLSMLFEKWPLEIWDARKLVRLKSFHPHISRPVALTWSIVNPQKSTGFSTDQAPGPATLHSDEKSASGGGKGNVVTAYTKETFILCTSPVSLKLFTMEGADVDTMPISDTIIQSIPSASCNNIVCAAWRSPLIAFGTSDGLIVVRNLQKKETTLRYMSHLVSPAFSPQVSPTYSNRSSTGRTSPEQSLLSSTGVSAVLNQAFDYLAPQNLVALKRIEFLPGSVATSRLLALCNSAITIWEPRQMLLVCIARFGNNPERSLIDATWSTTIIASPSEPPICALLAMDGSLRLAMAGSVAANQTFMDNDDLEISPSSEYIPSSQFEFSSPVLVNLNYTDCPLIPSLLPVNVSFTVKHLLQHQPWNSCPADKCENFKNISCRLVCPPLSTGFKEVYSTANQFFNCLSKMQPLKQAFESLELGVAERCLLTGILFGDAYETAFWRVAAHRLAEYYPTSIPSEQRRFRLDIVWDALAEQDLYKAAVMQRVYLLNQKQTPEQSKLCSQYLLMLGFQKQAIHQLAESPADSPNFCQDLYRASLLAASIYIDSLEVPASTPSPMGQADESSRSPARLNYTSTIKLLAASLISSKHLHEGIELLCMLGLQQDACRYLESYNEWSTAVWLAKCTLSKSEADEIIRRWALYLASHANQKSLAILVLVYLGMHEGVLNLLHSLRQHQLAVRYLEACLECGALKPQPRTEKLFSQIYLEFARTLVTLGHKESSIYYANLAGSLGEQVRKEVDFLLS